MECADKIHEIYRKCEKMDTGHTGHLFAPVFADLICEYLPDLTEE